MEKFPSLDYVRRYDNMCTKYEFLIYCHKSRKMKKDVFVAKIHNEIYTMMTSVKTAGWSSG